jgi:integrase
MAQRGELLGPLNGSYFARYYADGKRRMKKLGRVTDFSTDTAVELAFQQFMAEVNSEDFRPEPTTLLSKFVNETYFPNAERRLRGSSIKGYRACWKHLEPRLGRMKVASIEAVDIQKALDAIIRANPDLRLATLTRIKSFVREIVTEARNLGLRSDNPVSGVRINCSKQARQKTETQAYTLDEVRLILSVVPEPSKVLLSVAAFGGLRRGEIIGLKWSDYDGNTLTVRRNIAFGEKGNMSVEAPKTTASAAPVPVIAPLRNILDGWKTRAVSTLKSLGGHLGDCWIFQSEFVRGEHSESLLDFTRKTPLNPQNALRDAIAPALKLIGIDWRGYHAFRRGLATILRSLNVDDLTISEILRHSDVAVTRQSYIKRVSAKSTEAMSRLEAEVNQMLPPAINLKERQISKRVRIETSRR